MADIFTLRDEIAKLDRRLNNFALELKHYTVTVDRRLGRIELQLEAYIRELVGEHPDKD